MHIKNKNKRFGVSLLLALLVTLGYMIFTWGCGLGFLPFTWVLSLVVVFVFILCFSVAWNVFSKKFDRTLTLSATANQKKEG